MDLNQEEIELLFGIAKFPCDKASIEFPLQGEFIEVELQNEAGRIKFQSDINRANNIVSKITFQLRHLKTYTIRRLDLYPLQIEFQVKDMKVESYEGT